MSWHNVSRREPCPICGKPDWCSVSDDGRTCVCRREPSAHPCKSGNGWIHSLGGPHCSSDSLRELGFASADTGDRPVPPNHESPNGLVGGDHRAPRIVAPPRLDAEAYYAALRDDAALLGRLAGELGVPAWTLESLGVRWDGLQRSAAPTSQQQLGRGRAPSRPVPLGPAAFPMRDASGRITGIRLRALGTGRKWSVKGSKDGLFLPQPQPSTSTFSPPQPQPSTSTFSPPQPQPSTSTFSLPQPRPSTSTFSLPQPRPSTSTFSPPQPQPSTSTFSPPQPQPSTSTFSPHLHIVEGASDVAAGLAMGLDVVGRSSCLSGAALLADYIARHGPARVTIIADNDPPKRRPNGSAFTPGIDGARQLADHLRRNVPNCPPVEIRFPPDGWKDLREAWRRRV